MQIYYPAHMSAVGQLNIVYGISMPGATVRLLLNGKVIADAKADNDGKWSYEFASAIRAGGLKSGGIARIITASDGKEYAQSEFFIRSNFSAPMIIYPKNGTVTEGNELYVSGAASPHSGVKILLSGREPLKVSADNTGLFNYKFSKLNPGDYRLSCMQEKPSQNLYSPYISVEFSVEALSDNNAKIRNQKNTTLRQPENEKIACGTKSPAPNDKNSDSEKSSSADPVQKSAQFATIRKKYNSVILKGLITYKPKTSTHYQRRNKSIAVGRFERKLTKTSKNGLKVKIDIIKHNYVKKRR